ncbi:MULTISPECIES: ABC transporter permease [Arthrobacter]|uniref:ABC transporter permease n=2 Tax=Arthrobacter TaxID=1663 RepID=A0ABU9KR60_9MICC|nr:ABC transporter permease [Arthrobacter sp. YJM1]MDP5228586.1 ABC transporter permease [Arthrobacter sp. YJM1]
MLRVALSQLKAHSRRFIAVGLAIMLAVAFLVSTLLVSSSTKASLAASLGESYHRADLIVFPQDSRDAFTAQDLKTLSTVPGVASVYGQSSLMTVADSRDGGSFGAVIQNTAPAELEPATARSGILPGREGDVAVDAHTAEQYHLGIGDVLRIRPATVQNPGGDTASSQQDLKISGILEPTADPLRGSMSQLVTSTQVLDRLSGGPAKVAQLQLKLSPGADPGTVRTAVEHAMGAQPVASSVRTPQEAALEQVKHLTGGQDQLTIVLVAFAVIALFVSALVVANTFSVIIAQRTRELALLRCIGATRSQIRSSVLAEAAIVGLVSSLVGALAGVGVMAGLIALAKTDPSRSFATLAVDPVALATGVVVGMVMTVVAALFPARGATRVAPLAALRPADDASLGNRRGRVRLVIGAILLLLGLPLLLGGAWFNQLLVALPGGLLTFLGVLFCAGLFIPGAVRAVGRLARASGVPGRLAALNAVRNPARTSATASALLIGVTLVSMMMVGAGSAKAALSSGLAEHYPVDVTVLSPHTTGSSAGAPQGFGPTAVQTADSVNGVASAALLRTVGTLPAPAEQGGGTQEVYALDPATAHDVLTDKNLRLANGTIVVPKSHPAGPVTVTGSRGTITLQAVQANAWTMLPVMTEDDARSINGGALPQTGTQLWVKLADTVQPSDIRTVVNALGTALNVPQPYISGAAIERASFEEVINVLLLVVTALLAVAVFIALIGVANTLSLSVLERTRENSLLRALGLTRRQLRLMLALEAVLIAGVSALLGVLLGSAFGWLGAKSAIGGLGAVPFDAPWAALLGTLLVAVVAALLASIVPARRAARLSPVEGLATT